MTIEAVVYDIGNVLIRWQPEAYYDARIGADRRRALFDAVDLHGMNQRIDDGAAFRETVYRTAEAHPGWADEIRLWHDDWLGIADPVIEGSVTLFNRLKARGVPVFILSNIGDAVFDLAAGHHVFLGAADRAYVSGRLKLSKPDPRIYAAVEDGCRCDPAALLFVDDREDNCAAAEARGWSAHRFDGPGGWGARLADEGLLSPDEARL